ncbi:MAG: GyrI-like domain-containing protein [Myxococcales bacterium]|nr:GyrI-like domain-containing protein [Myxococcales bacterium]
MRRMAAATALLALVLLCCEKEETGPSGPQPIVPPPGQGAAQPAQPGQPAQPTAPAHSAEVQKFLDEAIAAAGGAEKLSALQAITFDSRGTYMGMKFTSTNYLAPDGMRMDIRGDYPMLMVMGEKCFSAAGPVVIPCSAEERANYKLGLILNQAARLVPLRDAAVWELSLDGTKLTVLHKDEGAKGTLAFDPQSKLLVGITYRGKFMGKEGEFVTAYSEHRDFEGLKFPTQVKESFEGQGFADYQQEAFKAVAVDAERLVAPPQVEFGKVSEKKLPAATLACVTHMGPYTGIGAAIEKFMAAVMEKKLPMAGPMMMIYKKAPPQVKDPKKFETEVCLPVAVPAKTKLGKGELRLVAQKPMKVLSLYGQGDYGQKAGEAMGALMKEVAAKKKKPAGPCMQVTFMDPKAYPPEELIFEVVQPIR